LDDKAPETEEEREKFQSSGVMSLKRLSTQKGGFKENKQ